MTVHWARWAVGRGSGVWHVAYVSAADPRLWRTACGLVCDPTGERMVGPRPSVTCPGCEAAP